MECCGFTLCRFNCSWGSLRAMRKGFDDLEAVLQKESSRSAVFRLWILGWLCLTAVLSFVIATVIRDFYLVESLIVCWLAVKWIQFKEMMLDSIHIDGFWCQSSINGFLEIGFVQKCLALRIPTGSTFHQDDAIMKKAHSYSRSLALSFYPKVWHSPDI